MSEHELTNYVVVPRQIASDYRNGLLNHAELITYLWMRINANPYGIAHINLEGVAEDVFRSSKKKNYANKILLSLKSKRYIYYNNRAGRRGSFEVHFGEWILPTKNQAGKPGIKSLEDKFAAAEVRTKSIELLNPDSEQYTEDEFEFQRSKSEEDEENLEDFLKKTEERVRGYDNDTENKKENEKETKRRFSYENRSFSINEFRPKTYEEQLCFEIGRKIGEKDMRFLIGSLKKYGIEVIQDAYLKLERAVKRGEVEDPCKLLNSIIQQEAEYPGMY